MTAPHNPTSPLVPEPVAVGMAGGAVVMVLEGAWEILPWYVAACVFSIAALRRASRTDR